MSKEAVEAIKIGSTQDRVAEGVQQSDFFITDSEALSAYSQQFQIGWNKFILEEL